MFMSEMQGAIMFLVIFVLGVTCGWLLAWYVKNTPFDIQSGDDDTKD